MRLTDAVIDALRKAGVEVYFADRTVTKVWNEYREDGNPVQFGGWYWYQSKNGKVISTDEEGPFRSKSAAMRDAYVKLQLRWSPARRP